MNKNDPLFQYSIDLERENEKLKNDIRKRDQEINRLVLWKKNQREECEYTEVHTSDEFGKYTYMTTTCCGEIVDNDWDRDWTYCPYCGGVINWKENYPKINRRLGVK